MNSKVEARIKEIAEGGFDDVEMPELINLISLMVADMPASEQVQVIGAVSEQWVADGEQLLNEDNQDSMLLDLSQGDDLNLLTGMYQVSMVVEISTLLGAATEAIERYVTTEKVIRSLQEREDRDNG